MSDNVTDFPGISRPRLKDDGLYYTEVSIAGQSTPISAPTADDAVQCAHALVKQRTDVLKFRHAWFEGVVLTPRLYARINHPPDVDRHGVYDFPINPHADSHLHFYDKSRLALAAFQHSFADSNTAKVIAEHTNITTLGDLLSTMPPYERDIANRLMCHHTVEFVSK
ncbi:MAG: hypothetical protein OER96_11465 [Gammaproteobacteria bacterium]|nr:hypothetical protein [Gammaproteobacteria bacterium]